MRRSFLCTIIITGRNEEKNLFFKNYFLSSQTFKNNFLYVLANKAYIITNTMAAKKKAKKAAPKKKAAKKRA